MLLDTEEDTDELFEELDDEGDDSIFDNDLAEDNLLNDEGELE